MATHLQHHDERRVENAHDWIEGICRQFSEITSWPLKFHPATDGGAIKDANSDFECCWQSDIHDGQDRVGQLRIDLPEDATIDRSFLTISKLADLYGHLIGRLSAANHTLDSRTRDVSTLVDIGLTIPNEDDLLDALKQLLRASVQLTDFRSAGFFLLDAYSEELNLRVVHHLDVQQIPRSHRQLGDEPPDLKALTSGPIVLHRAESMQDAIWLPQGAATGLCVAVESEEGPIGTLWAFDRRHRQPSNREAHVLESLGAQIASVLERVVLLRESQVQNRIQRELDSVSEIQERIETKPTLSFNGFHAASRCVSRYEIGGDLCEFVALDDRRTAIAIGDASGDGIPAAIVMTAVRGALRVLLAADVEEVLQTHRVVENINRALHGITPAHQFMTFLFAVLDAESRTLTYTNAGHPIPILAQSGEISQLDSHGMLLGVVDDSTYSRSTLQLHSGDLLVLFSDGIIEAMNQERQMFRDDGIIHALKPRLNAAVDEVFEAIWTDCESHSAGGDPDDRTLVVIRVD